MLMENFRDRRLENDVSFVVVVVVVVVVKNPEI